MISFTVETDGRLPTGESLGEAIETVERATANGPAYDMINCAHPTHCQRLLRHGPPPHRADLHGVPVTGLRRR